MHYLILLRNSRDVRQISTLAGQTGMGSQLTQAYFDAVSRPFGYVLVDLHPRNEHERFWLRTSIVSPGPTLVYLKDSESRYRPNFCHARGKGNIAMPCWNNNILWVENFLSDTNTRGQNAYWWSSIPTTVAVFLWIFMKVYKRVFKHVAFQPQERG